MSDVVRYGIIGTGMMGCEHIMNLALVPGAKVTAIADPNRDSQSWGRSLAGDGVEVYEDYRELLKSAAVDAVVVATPNFTHCDVLQDVFRTRKHILVEKPLCTEVDDCRKVVDQAARHPALVWVGMEYRFMPAVAPLIARVHGGDVGALRMVAIREHRFPFLPKVGNWNRFARNTGGTLVEKCCHFFDLMNLVTRLRPVRVYASAGCDVNHLDERYDGEIPDIIDNAFVIVDFSTGARGLLDLCMFAENSVNEVEIAATGDRGKIEAFEPGHRLVFGLRGRADRQEQTFDLDPRVRAAGAHHGSTYLEHLAFLDAVRTGSRPTVTAEDGALAVAVGAAAERSARLRQPVEMRDLGF